MQALLIAFGAFALENNIDKGPVSDGDTTGVTLHHSFAYVVVLFAVALLAVSFGAKVQHGVRWAAIPLGLVVVQFFLAYAAYSAAIVGVLHGLNALAIFAVALLAGRRVPKAAPVAEPSAAEEAPVLWSGPTLGPPTPRPACLAHLQRAAAGGLAPRPNTGTTSVPSRQRRPPPRR